MRRLNREAMLTGLSRQVFGLRIHLAGSFPGLCRTQWTSARSSPLPLRVSPGLRPGSLGSRSHLDRLNSNRTLATRPVAIPASQPADRLQRKLRRARRLERGSQVGSCPEQARRALDAASDPTFCAN